MMEGCEVGVDVQRAQELLSSTDTPFHRETVTEAAFVVASCVTCQGNPGEMEGNFACPVLEDPVMAVTIRSALRADS